MRTAVAADENSLSSIEAVWADLLTEIGHDVVDYVFAALALCKEDWMLLVHVCCVVGRSWPRLEEMGDLDQTAARNWEKQLEVCWSVWQGAVAVIFQADQLAVFPKLE